MSTIEQKTEQALARIFAHCDAVASGEKPTPSVEDGEKMAVAFLGNLNVKASHPPTLHLTLLNDESDPIGAGKRGTTRD